MSYVVKLNLFVDKLNQSYYLVIKALPNGSKIINIDQTLLTNIYTKWSEQAIGGLLTAIATKELKSQNQPEKYENAK